MAEDTTRPTKKSTRTLKALGVDALFLLERLLWELSDCPEPRRTVSDEVEDKARALLEEAKIL